MEQVEGRAESSSPRTRSENEGELAFVEARLLAVLDGPDEAHEIRVEELAREFPAHAATLWRWLAAARRFSAPRPSAAERLPRLGHPERIGPYRLDARLGEGGMGTVYAATHTASGERLALKLIRADLLPHREAHERFRREVEALARVEHPAICEIREIGEEAGIPYLAMPLLEGEDLSRLLARHRARSLRGPMRLLEAAPAANERDGAPRDEDARAALERLLAFFEEAARALHAAHGMGLVHRDVKPANLFCTREGRAVLLDFGLARDEWSENSTLSGSRDLLGTVEYMAPEQVRGARGIDARADVYSLAASLYEALTLELPVRGSSRRETLERVLEVEPKPVHRRVPELPPALSWVLAQALEKEPRRRTRSALAFAEELGRVRRDERVAARPLHAGERLARWAKRNPWAAIALVSTSCFSIVALALVASRDLALERESDARRTATEALEKFQLTEHATRLQSATVAARALPPPTPEAVPRYDAWLATYAEPLRRALPQLREQRDQMSRSADARSEAATLERERLSLVEERARFAARCATLRPEAEPVDEFWAELGRMQLEQFDARIAEIERSIAESPPFAFTDGSRQFLFAEIRELVGAVERFLEDQRHGAVGIAQRREHALAVRELSVESHRAAWTEVCAAVRAGSPYGGLELEPQIGLVPLGADPRSGLQEFAVCYTGTVPLRHAGELVVDGESAIVLVLIPGGRYEIGTQKIDPSAARYDGWSPADMGPHPVDLLPYFLGKHELSQGQWKRLSNGKNPSYVRPGNVPFHQPTGDEYPVESLSWTFAREVLLEHGLDLPTEAQWETGARAGTDYLFPSSDEPADLEGYANLFGYEMGDFPAQLREGPAPFHDGTKLPLPVDALLPNGFGLHHAIGNVAEWCRDAWWTWRTPFGAGDGWIDIPLARYRTYRGGSYLDGWWYARIAFRRKSLPDDGAAAIGVRVARAVQRAQVK